MTNQLCLYPHFQEYLNKADNYQFHVIIHISRPPPSEKAIGWTCESGQLILILGLCLKIRICIYLSIFAGFLEADKYKFQRVFHMLQRTKGFFSKRAF